jgi:hypothetical protein
MKLELSERKAKITAVTPNCELHGESPKPVCYIRFATDLTGDDLAMFHPTLRSMLFEKSSTPDLADQGSDAPTALRFPFLKTPIHWEQELVGAACVLHYGATEKSHINLPGCIVSKFSLDPKNGGTITLCGTIASHPDEKQMGRLGMMVGTEIPLTITPPEPEAEDLAGKP